MPIDWTQNLGINPTNTKASAANINLGSNPAVANPPAANSVANPAANPAASTDKNAPSYVSPTKIYTQEELQSMGKMQDPVTHQLFDRPSSLAKNLTSGNPGIITSDSVRVDSSQSAADYYSKQQALDAEIADLTKQKQISDLKSSLETGISKPELPNYESSYSKLSSTPVVGSMSLNDINQAIAANQAKQRDLNAQITEYTQSLSGQGRTMADVSAAGTQKQKDMQLQLMNLQNEQANLTDQSNIANNYVNNLMNFKGMDYQAAVNDYNTNFSNNYQIQQLYNTEQSTVKTNAQAYLSSVSSMISNSGVDWGSIDPTLKANIYSQELKAGWEPGTLEAFAKADPSKQILGTVNGVDSNGRNTVSFIYKDPITGKPGVTETVNTGSYKETPLQTMQRQLTLARGTQMIESSKAMEANRIIGPQARLDPVLKRYNEAIAVKSRVDAASQDIKDNGPTDPNTKELIDSVTQLMTGGQQITEGQISLNTDYQSYASKMQVFLNKFNTSGGGAIGATVANQIMNLADETYKLYEKSYSQRIQSYNSRLVNVAGQDLTPYSPLTDMRNLPSVMDSSYDSALNSANSSLQGMDLSTLTSDQIQALSDAGLLQ